MKKAPEYETIETIGPDHAKEFKVGVFVEQKAIASAWGRSKKKASQAAAKVALENIKDMTKIKLKRKLFGDQHAS